MEVDFVFGVVVALNVGTNLLKFLVERLMGLLNGFLNLFLEGLGRDIFGHLILHNFFFFLLQGALCKYILKKKKDRSSYTIMAATLQKQNTVLHISALYAFKQVVRLIRESCKHKFITFEVWGEQNALGKAYLVSKGLSRDCVHTCKARYACTLFKRGGSLLDIPYGQPSKTLSCLFEFIVPLMDLSAFLSKIRLCAALQILFESGPHVILNQMDNDLEVQRSGRFEDVDPKHLCESQKIGRSIAWPSMHFSKVFSSEANWFLKNMQQTGVPKSSRKLTYFVYSDNKLDILNSFADVEARQADSKPAKCADPNTRFILGVETKKIRSILRNVNKQSIVTVCLNKKLPLVMTTGLGNANAQDSYFMCAIAPEKHHSW